ncbi:MAG: hypothetical protein IJ799_03700, partial [Bacteroidales bacterium]|nr:hypothetical protein [Bacteroidales bacterium]
QTAWLKCHYTAEFLAANLSCNLSNMVELKKVMADCKLHKIKVLNPDVNESMSYFTVNKEGNIRFGLGGLKGFGDNVVEFVLSEREANGPFADVWDFMERLAGKINRRALETLVYAGAFDSFGYKRSQFFRPGTDGDLFIDEIVRYADLYKNDTVDSATSLFGEMEEMKPVRPAMPDPAVEDDVLGYLQKEKEFCGMYLSSHPLDRYSVEIENFTNCELSDITSLIAECEEAKVNRKVYLAGMITEVNNITTRSGQPGCRVTLEDYSGVYELALYAKDYETYIGYMKLHESLFIEAEIKERYKLKPEEIAQGKPAPPYTMRLKKISLLGNLAADYITGINVKLTTPMLNPDFRKRLSKTIRENKGGTPLMIVLFDPETRYNVEFRSNKYQVAVTPDLLAALLELGLNWEIQKKNLA